jgi:hypothetical protein
MTIMTVHIFLTPFVLLKPLALHTLLNYFVNMQKSCKFSTSIQQNTARSKVSHLLKILQVFFIFYLQHMSKPEVLRGPSVKKMHHSAVGSL